MDFEHTERGFLRSEFTDRYRQKCSLQESSLATEACIWLGCFEDMEGKPSSRMHLTQDMVNQLLPALTHFAEHGQLPTP